MSTNRRRKNIIFLCTGNCCRSQMAEGYLRYFAGDKAYIYSAGVEARGVNSLAMTVMQEDGIDISGHTSNHMREYHLIDFDFVLTLCDPAKESCPLIPIIIKQIHVTFDDHDKATIRNVNIMQKFCKVSDIRESHTHIYDK